MRAILSILLVWFVGIAHAQTIGPGGGSGGGAPSGPAAGVLSGTYPNPGFAASPTFTGTVTINPSANANALVISGGSITGSSTTSPGISVTGTLNTTGVVDGAALFSNITNTASGAGTTLVDLQVGSVSQFKIGPTGRASSVDGGYFNDNGSLTGFFASGTSDFFYANGAIQLTINGSGLITLATITTDATHTDATVCEDTTSHSLYFGSGTAGICLGTSSERYKRDIADLSVGLDQIMRLRPVSYYLDAQHGDPTKLLYGFTAEQGIGVLPELAGLDAGGRPNTFDYLGVVPVLVRAIQQQQVEIEQLRRVVGGQK